MTAAQHSVMTAYMLHVLGLEHTADTLVGDAMVRGIRCGSARRGWRLRAAEADC